MRFSSSTRKVFKIVILSVALLVGLAACNNAPEGPVDDQGNIIGRAQIQAASVAVSGEAPPYDIEIKIKGVLPDACTKLGEASVAREDHRFLVELPTLRPSKERCTEEQQSFTKTIPLDGEGLKSGDHAVIVNGIQTDFSLDQDNMTSSLPPTPSPEPSPSDVIPDTPTPIISPSPTAMPSQAHENNISCLNRIKFIRDVTIPDGAKLKRNKPFTKTWRLQNVGDCTWTEDYALVFAGGHQMGGPDSQPLGTIVEPGEKVDISVKLVAPARRGKYTGQWLLQTPAGQQFGLGDAGDTPFWVRIRVR